LGAISVANTFPHDPLQSRQYPSSYYPQQHFN